MAESDKELELQLMEAGTKLVDPPSSLDQLIPLLDQVESCLSKVEQAPSLAMQNALSPSLNALVAHKLLRHPDNDVKVAVAACISEITRITAPDAPYDDDQMRAVFKLIVSSFENLSDNSSHLFIKRITILETVSKVRLCVVMLDLEYDALILEMFQHLLKEIRDHHSEAIFTSMETIMTLVLEESEDISVELLSPILASVKRDNEEVLPAARRLAERVLKNCASNLKPYLIQAVENACISFDGYSSVVASICQVAPRSVEHIDTVAEKCVDEESKPAESPLDKATQEDKEIPEEAVSTEQVGIANEKSPKLDVSNGIKQAAEGKLLTDSNSTKKQDEDHLSDKSKNDDASTVVEPDRLEAENMVNSDSRSEESTLETEKKYNSKPTEPSDNFCVNEKEAETLLDPKNDSKDDTGSLRYSISIDGAVFSENKQETDAKPSSPKPSEDESTDVASPTPSGTIPDESHSEKAAQQRTIPDESHSEKAAQPEGKESLSEETMPSVDDVPKKVSEGMSDSEIKTSRRSGKNAAQPRTIPDESHSEKAAHVEGKESLSEETTPSVDDVPKKVSEGTSDSEVKTNRRSWEKAAQPRTIPDESHFEKDSQPEGKESLSEETTPSVDDFPKKVSVGMSYSLVKTNRRTGERAAQSRTIPDESHSEKTVQPEGEESLSEETTLSVDDVPKKVSEGMSDSEVKTNRRSVKKAAQKRTIHVSHSEKAAQPEGKESLSEETTPSVDDVLEKESEGMSDSEVKTSRRSGKKVATVVSNKGNAAVDVDETKKESGSASGSEAKSRTQSSKKVDSRSSNLDGPSSRQLEDKKKRSRGKVVPEKDGTKTSTINDDEEVVASPKPVKPNTHDSHMEETPKTGSKRKYTSKKEKASGSTEYGENLVGLKVEVWWPKDRAFYEGVIHSFDAVKRKHKVHYDDGDTEVLNLKREKWKVIEYESGPDEEEAANQPSPDGSPETRQKKKAKTVDQPSKKTKIDASRRGGGTSTGKSKGAATKSGSKTKEDGEVNSKSRGAPKSVGKSDIDDITKSKDHTTKSGSKSIDAAVKVGNKSKNDDSGETPKSAKSKHDGSVAPKASTKLKQGTSKSSKSTKQETPKISSTSKGKPLKSGGKSNDNGTGKSRSASSNIEESDSMKENSTDSAKVMESAKRKSPSSTKAHESDSMSAKKRRQ